MVLPSMVAAEVVEVLPFPLVVGVGGEGEAFGRPLCPLCNTSGLDNLGLDVDEICSLHWFNRLLVASL